MTEVGAGRPLGGLPVRTQAQVTEVVGQLIEAIAIPGEGGGHSLLGVTIVQVVINLTALWWIKPWVCPSSCSLSIGELLSLLSCLLLMLKRLGDLGDLGDVL
jgi:hypothetical protein